MIHNQLSWVEVLHIKKGQGIISTVNRTLKSLIQFVLSKKHQKIVQVNHLCKSGEEKKIHTLKSTTTTIVNKKKMG